MPAPDAPETPVPELAPNTSSDLAPTPFATGLSDTAPANDPANDLEPLRRALAAVWNPIPGLASPLRYRLTLGPTGEILAIEPLTAPSRQYLAQNAWPQVGERVPNLRLPEPTIVEVELLSSGEVNLHQPP